MPQTIPAAGFTQDAFDAFLQSRDEPAWLTSLRQQAWQTFQETPLPAGNLEQWRRTDIRLLKLDRFGLPRETSETPPPALLAAGVDLAGQISSFGGRVIQSNLEERYQQQGVLFGSLEELLSSHPDQLRPHFESSWRPDVDKFAALGSACFTGGSVLYVPRGVTIKEPLHSLSSMAAGGSDLSRALVILEDGAEATLLAETAGLSDDPGLHCGAIDLIVKPNARLRYVNLQNWGTGVWHFAHQQAIVDRDATLQWTIGALGSRLAKVNQHVVLAGQGARAQVNGAMFAEGKQHLSYHTLQHHQQPHGTSDLLYKGALQDHAHLVWRGMIQVDPGAQRTNGYQRNDNLMLSDHARADSIPGLEIEADDVICTHGATTGRVDDEQIFYAQCRSLTRKEAIRMIVAGFFQQVFDRITIDSVREALGQAIGRRIREYE